MKGIKRYKLQVIKLIKSCGCNVQHREYIVTNTVICVVTDGY